MKNTTSEIDPLKILSDITVYSKYAKHIPSKDRRETWDEIVTRNMEMHLKKFPHLATEIEEAYDLVYDKKILPSMRSMQFAGKPVEINPARIYNCCYLPVNDYRSFSEAMFLLLGGTGVGYSVQKHHVEELPEIRKPSKSRRFLIADSIEGWADAVKALMKSYFGLSSKPLFDFSDIRPKGAMLVTAGGKAPGPDPLKECLFKIEQILNNKEDGSKLTTLECHDILCHIANAVLAGGIRRAAMICGFDFDDEDMLTCKFGNWWELNEQRGRANNSAILLRHKITKEQFMNLWAKIEASGSGEPGFYLSNDKDWFTNPCCFTGDMKLLTHEGYKAFKHLDGQEGLAYNKDGELVPFTVWSNGLKDIVKVKTVHTEWKCTPDHKFMLNTGEECEAKDLVGKRLMPYFEINKEISEYTKYGFIQGDGGLGRLSSDKHKGLEIYFGKDDSDVAEIFNSELGKQYINGYNEILNVLGFSSDPLPTRMFPKTFPSWKPENKLQFLKGMYSANGSIIKNHRIAYKSTCRFLIEDLQHTLSLYNIDSYITTNKSKEVTFKNGNYTCKESYDLNITKLSSILNFAKQIGFIHSYKQQALEELIKVKAPKVLSVKECGQEEVYDFSLDDDTHWGIVEGVVVHNCEIALRPYQFCNLCEVNVSDIESQEDLNKRVKAAAFIGTLQASYTNFHYLRDIWKRTTEKDALIGVGMTGIGSGEILKYDLNEAAKIVKQENARVAVLIDINKAARATCVKPSGTSSLVLGTASGIHAWHAPYYIRRIRVGKNEALYTYLSIYHPELVEDDFFRPTTQAIIQVPVKAPKDAIIRTESPIQLLERVQHVSNNWIKTGHRSGNNTHNVSATISINKDQWSEVGEWMWDNRDSYNGLSVLPYDNGTYKQAPFEDITEEQYNEMVKHLHNLDLTKIVEINDTTDLKGEAACAGGQCEI